MCSVGGIVVSIAAFQAVDPGSIPGQRKVVFLFFFFLRFLMNYTGAIIFCLPSCVFKIIVN